MVSRNIPQEYFVLSATREEGPVIGYVNDRPIASAVVDGNGSRYRFVGLARRDREGRLDVLSLRHGEWIVAPNLIYEEAA
ncbi:MULTISPECIES: hypothetical protein [unclassified Rhizobium]|jgi:hypothetical protein|uniref:hypothetical protein n=1 Tax=unclassified Rhizobium TaxID=2613769 RepID=UPI000648B721|nr:MULTISPECIES: hypothetical protein [unclassified Rhizobium]MBN8950517.1 hypothetical protein [Rhizobium tropici]OJY66077.1 MAG: hypothetical protein BGP09_29355 [Rhizobium sp. 60-20]RKD69385.1 hypothetical protein BJ928_104525 [Rhizobium sp. WW_1]